MSAYFVTGAGTEIGKTYVSCALLRAWRAQAAACSALKPVVSGYSETAFERSDPALLLDALGVAANADRIARIAPWRFAAALAPPLAAKAEGKAVDFEEVVQFCRAQIRANSGGPLLIEGAGGVMAPLTETHTSLDLIAALGAPVIFVAGSYLGAVSHALTGLEVLNARGAHVALVIVSESKDSAGLEATHDMVRAHAPGVRVRIALRGDAAWAVEAARLLLRPAAM